MSDAAKRKIASLLKMTRSAGCSEAEAIAAAEKAAALMQEHGLSTADVLFTKAEAKATTGGRGVRDRIWVSLAVNTNTSLIYANGTAIFVGQGPGPEIASYLYAVLNRAVDREIASYKATPNYRRRTGVASRRRAVQDFTDAMGLRLRHKLNELFANVRSRTAVVAAEAARDAMFPDGRPVTPAQAPRRNAVAARMGDMAGGRVELAHGVGGQESNLQIAR